MAREDEIDLGDRERDGMDVEMDTEEGVYEMKAARSSFRRSSQAFRCFLSFFQARRKLTRIKTHRHIRICTTKGTWI